MIICGSGGEAEETSTLYIEDLSAVVGEEGREAEGSWLQREMQVKAFLLELQGELARRGERMEEEGERSFRLRIGYRHESGGKEGRELLDGWVARGREAREGRIACSLKSATLNLIYEIAQ